MSERADIIGGERQRETMTALGDEQEVVTGGASVVAIAAGTAADTPVKASPGRLATILVTATGTNPLQVYDNASGHTGTVIGALPASPAIGTVQTVNMPAANGITVAGNAANPGVTISYY